MRNLPVFMNDGRVAQALGEAKRSIPKGSQAYLYGGAVRNAVYFEMFGEKLPQRDYDLLFVGDIAAFVRNLRKRGFAYGKVRKSWKVVMKKGEYVALDTVIKHDSNMRRLLIGRANFTINGFAFSLRFVDSPKWRRHVLAVPGARRDLKRRRLVLNQVYAISIFACLRFMSQGFRAPSQKEVAAMLESLKTIEKVRHSYDVQKTYDYCGKRQAHELARRLGAGRAIFDFSKIKQAL